MSPPKTPLFQRTMLTTQEGIERLTWMREITHASNDEEVIQRALQVYETLLRREVAGHPLFTGDIQTGEVTQITFIPTTDAPKPPPL